MTVTELEVEAGVREKQETHRSISVESKVCQERNRKKKRCWIRETGYAGT